MDVKTIKYEIQHTRDTRMTKVMVSSEVIAGTYVGCFLPCWAPQGPHTSSEGREYGGFVSRGLGILRGLRIDVDTWEGIPVSSSLIHRPRIDQPENVLFKKLEGDCN